jgi:hypothetical protein
MADVARAGGHNSDALETVMADSKAVLLFLALILANDSPRTMVVNRGTLARIPDERNDGKRAIGRPIKKVLRVRPGWNYSTILFLQPITIGDKASQ